ncbi:recombinase family protein (plasmid) [Vallitalea pronyensis]|uniref:Recombinase family protein n=1 Tax=Vallitalea pronyensis TaxID=1348613 RepID=A0A8J8MR87_9FIRM|nr:recombinase family protein [Vallitalea pronyensis]QUI25938.1 recombinase family protein [Vallitalea pronyensis]
MNYAYQRVSTKRQDVKRQEISLDNYKIDKKYIDKASGKNMDRIQLNKLKLVVQQGDNIYVESISRLGRNVNDLRELGDYFVKKGAVVHFIKEGFSTNSNMYKFYLTILGAVAEIELENTNERVREGIKKAKLYGTKSGRSIGRPPITKLPPNFEKYYDKCISDEITKVEFAKLMEVSRRTIYRYIDFYKMQKSKE